MNNSIAFNQSKSVCSWNWAGTTSLPQAPWHDR